MSTWFSPKELAEANLQNFPKTRSKVSQKAEREGWESRDRVGRGGGKEYLIPDRYQTPELVKALQDRFGDRFPDLSTNVDVAPVIDYDTNHIAEVGQVVEVLGNSEELVADHHIVAGNKNSEDKAFEMPIESDKSTAVTLARIEICRKAKEFWQESGLNKVAAYEQFVSEVNSGRIELPEFVKVGLQTKERKLKLSRASLTNWEGQSIKELTPKHQGKKGFFDSRPDYELVAEAFVRNYPDNAARMLHHAFESGLIKEDFGLEEAPSYSQIYVWLKNRKEQNSERQRAFRTGDKSILLDAFGSLSRGLKPNDKWEIDSTKTDATSVKRIANIVWLASKSGETAVRCALVACIDVATRRLMIKLFPTSNGEAICLVIAECIRQWGLPKTIKMDNGKDYIGDEVSKFLIALGIERKTCIVRHPWEKGHIERIMRSLQHSAPWQMLPWSTGHSVATQQAKRKRNEGEAVLPWTIEEFQSWLDRWVDDYHSQVHSGMGISPLERLATFTADGFVAFMPKDLEANLTFAMMRERTVKVGKKGISYGGRFYVAKELIEHYGESLIIRVDHQNLNEILVYSDRSLDEAAFICKATWSEALTDEQLARLATAIPAVDQALVDNEKAVKRNQKRIKDSLKKNPEKLLPERGGIAALAAFQEMEVNSSKLVKQIEAAAAKPVINTDAPEIQAKRKEWLDMQTKKEAEKPVEEEIRTGHDWRRIWGDKDRSVADTEWLLQTIDIGGYGGFVAMIERKSLDEMRETLEKELTTRVA